MTSESPATQSRSFRFGVKAILAGGLGVVVPDGFGAGFGLGFGADDCRRHDDGDVDLVLPAATGSGLECLPRPVEEEGVAHPGKAAGESKGDVPFRSRLAVERRLVHAGRHQQRPEEDCEERDDERVPGGREGSARIALDGPRRAPFRAACSGSL